MENSLFCSNSEINGYINARARKVHREVVKAYGNAYAGTSTDVTTVAGTAAYALPAAFMKLSSYGVWWVQGSHNTLLHRYNPNEALSRLSTQGWTSYPYGAYRSNVRYDLFNKQIRFLPTPQAVYTVRVHYIPTPTTLSADADVYDGIMGLEECITWLVAADMLAKQESDNSHALRMAESELKDLLEHIEPDQNEPAHVQWADPDYEWE